MSRVLGSVRGQQIEDRAVNPDKKGEEVTEKLAGLSEELMNTPQPFRGAVPAVRSRPGVHWGAEAETSGWPLKMWGTGHHGGQLSPAR